MEGDRRSIPAAVLRGVILLQCLGLFGIYYVGANETESDIFGLLYFDWGYPEPFAQTVDDAGTFAAMFSGVMIAALGCLRFLQSPDSDRRPPSLRRQIGWAGWLDRVSLLVLTTWFLALAVAHHIRGGPYAQLATGEHAVRFMAPLALLFCIPRARDNTLHDRWRPAANVLLRIAAAATFAVHGYKAVDGYGPFLDLILLSGLSWTSWQLSESVVTVALSVIGWIDLVVAAIVLTRWWRYAAVYMTIWGVITAASRMTALGVDYWPATLLRAANGGVPLVLVLSYWKLPPTSRES